MSQTFPKGASEELRVAAQILIDHADAADNEIDVNPYWHSGYVDRAEWYAHGMREGLGGKAAEFAALLGPEFARLLAAWLMAESRQELYTLAEFGHRSANPHAITLASSLSGTPTHTPEDVRRAKLPTPVNARPYRVPHESGPTLRTMTLDGDQVWRQVGWHGQTGALYAYDERPQDHEGGNFAPLWVLIDNDRPIPDEPDGCE